MSDPIEILERRLCRVVDNQQDTRGLHFFCQIGGDYTASGMVTLQISGSGWTLVGFHGDERRDLYSVHLPQRDLKRFYAMLLNYPFWDASPNRRPRQPGEINIHMRVVDQPDSMWHGLQCWDTDMKEFPVLRELMYRVMRIIRNIADDDIPLFPFEQIEEGD